MIHNGALVNHAFTYEQLFEPNVLGSLEVQRALPFLPLMIVLGASPYAEILVQAMTATSCRASPDHLCSMRRWCNRTAALPMSTAMHPHSLHAFLLVPGGGEQSCSPCSAPCSADWQKKGLVSSILPLP